MTVSGPQLVYIFLVEDELSSVVLHSKVQYSVLRAFAQHIPDEVGVLSESIVGVLGWILGQVNSVRDRNSFGIVQALSCTAAGLIMRMRVRTREQGQVTIHTSA